MISIGQIVFGLSELQETRGLSLSETRLSPQQEIRRKQNTKVLQICRKICWLGCVTRALVHAWFTQPSPRIFLHFCKDFLRGSSLSMHCEMHWDIHFSPSDSTFDFLVAEPSLFKRTIQVSKIIHVPLRRPRHANHEGLFGYRKSTKKRSSFVDFWARNSINNSPLMCANSASSVRRYLPF